VFCKTAFGLESPQDRLGGTHAEDAGHPDVVGPLLLNASLLLVLTIIVTDQCNSLNLLIVDNDVVI